MRKVRGPVVDEIFYPSDPRALTEAVTGLLGASRIAAGEAAALVLPHAAYPIAGGLLAAGFRAACARRIRRVLFLAPMHRDAGNQVVLPESQAFLTPLGEVPVDTERTAELEGWSTAFVRSDVPHLEEHSVEVCLPFVQVAFPDASIVPVLVGQVPAGLLRTLGRALNTILDGSWDTTLAIASTNLNGESGGLREANAFLRAMGALGAQGATGAGRAPRPAARAAAMLEAAHSGRVTACGACAVASLLELAPAAGEPRLLGRGDSGNEAPRRTYYAAIAIG
jgi:predicted class III extradiol MEMO1 family dioxygenase